MAGPAPPPLLSEDWFYEDYAAGSGLIYHVEKEIYRGATKFQEVLIFQNNLMGKILVLDGVVQSTQADENVYHEMLSLVPILAHGAARKALIIGGGDGGMLRHCLMHPDMAAVTMVDIDPELVTLCRRFLPEWNAGAYEDPRTSFIAGDGVAFVRDTDEKFDVIIIDSTDPVGPGKVLFTEEFYRDCKTCLTPGGVITLQSGVPFTETRRLPNLRRNLGAVFDDMTVYIAAVPTYHGGYMAFGWGSDNAALRDIGEEVLSRRLVASAIATKFYTAAVHKAAFALPNFMLEQLSGNQGNS